jgi:non-homologous end joining protein Ku
VESGKIAIAKIVIRTRQHVAAVNPQKKGADARIDAFSGRTSGRIRN